MDDLVSWLEAQIAEDERPASKAAAAMNSRGHDGPTRQGRTGQPAAACLSARTAMGMWDCEGSETLTMADEWAEHAAAWDPSRVLAECEAKRAMIAPHRPVNVMIGGDLGGDSAREPGVVCWHCIGPANQEHNLSWIDLGEAVHWPCRHLRIYAALYAKLGRPGYQESWRLA